MPKVVEEVKVVKPFKTKFDDHERVYMNSGDVEFPIRKARKVDGVLVVDETKEMFNMHDYIQSFRDSVDVEIILKRFTAGDQDAIEKLTRSYGDYLDLSQIPDNFNDMMALAQRGHDMFNELPVEIKEKFGNNYETFVSNVGTAEWMEKMGYERETETDPVEASGTAKDIEE